MVLGVMLVLVLVLVLVSVLMLLMAVASGYIEAPSSAGWVKRCGRDQH
jgi:hypothetical protein